MIKIFVEGPDDKNFVADFINHLGLSNAKPHDVASTNGWEKIQFLNNIIEQNKDKGGFNFIIFDADKNYNQRRADIFALIKDPNWIDGLFLFPDNNSSGCLESLLITIANQAHQNLHSCFDNYRNCVINNNPDYITPDDKAKIYAYLACLGLNPKVGSRKYVEQQYWELTHQILNNLISFIQSIFQ